MPITNTTSIITNTSNMDAGPTLSSVCGGSQIFIFMALLDGILQTLPDVNGPMCNPKSIETPTPNTKYDFIVVGAGPAGCVVAARLSENPEFRVLLIEAGGGEPVGLQIPLFNGLFFGSSVDWNYRTESNGKSYLNSPGQASTWTSGKMLGGSSSLNGMVYMRGNPADYDRWSRMGNAGWDYDSVLPFFRRSENNTDRLDRRYHGTDGPVSIGRWSFPDDDAFWLKAAIEAGFPIMDDLNGAHHHSGFMKMQTFIRRGVRESVARAFLEPAVNRENLHVWLNTRVTRVLLDETRRAYGVETIDAGGGKTAVLANAEVILCAGTVESPKLLQLSGIGAADDLLEVGITPIVELGAVGKNLQDHVGVVLPYNIQQANQVYLNHEMVDRYLETREGPLASLTSYVSAKLASKYASGPQDPDLHMFFGNDLGTMEYLCSKLGLKSQVRSDRVLGISAYLLRPKSRGHIKLASDEPNIPPHIFPNMLDVDSDVDALLDAIAMMEKLMATSVFQQYNITLIPQLGGPTCMKLPFRSEAFWRCVVRHGTVDGRHRVGTCRMGAVDDPLGAVVDAELRVHGVDGLRVMDASVMPASLSGNTEATTMMIAEKGVEMLRRSWA